MMKWRKFFTVFLSCFTIIPCNAAPILRHKKLSPLNSQALSEVVQKLGSVCPECAFIFDLKTTKNRKTETEEGRFYSQKVSDKVNLRVGFGNETFLFLGPSDGEIFCSEPLKKITLNDPLQSGHPLSFSDILMPFLEWKSYEYRHSKRVQGQNTHIIRFKETKTGQMVDIAYDPVFKAILQFECFDEKEKLLRTFKLLDLKKTQDTWLMKSVEIRDIPNDIMTLLTIKKVALKQTIPASIFDKNTLEKPFVDHLNYIDF